MRHLRLAMNQWNKFEFGEIENGTEKVSAIRLQRSDRVIL